MATTSSRDSSSTFRSDHRRHPSSSSSSRTTLKLNLQHARSPEPHTFEKHIDKAASTSSQTPPKHNKTSRIMSSVRRSLSVSCTPQQKKQLPLDIDKIGMYSTPAERATQYSTRSRKPDPFSSPPSIEQIAMGLHTSRTPHLRSASVPHYPFSQRPNNTVPLPPPPARSALKKTGTTSSSAPSLAAPSVSSTTVTSSNPSTPRSNRSLFSIKTRMSRILPGSQSFSSAPSSVLPSLSSSPRVSTSEFVPPRKAVRFSTSTLSLDAERRQG